MTRRFGGELDLPLTDAAPGRFLAWIAAVAVFTAALAFALAAGASATAHHAALQPRLATVLVPAGEDHTPSDADVERLVAALVATPGVAFARAVEPGELGLTDGAPMPRFIDIAINPGSDADLAALVDGLGFGARIVSDGTGQVRSSLGLQLLAWLTGLGALMAVAVAAATITRISLSLHRDTIDLLRQLGAADAYLVQQFEQHAWGQALRGGVLGFLAALLAAVVDQSLPRDLLPALALPWLDWLFLGVLPAGAAMLGAVAAGLATRARLRRSA
jgi:cell division transport system permease protein